MNGTIQYTIRPYDTIWMLAQVFNTTVDSIMNLNPGLEPRNLLIGQVISIRPGHQYSPSNQNRSGETGFSGGNMGNPPEQGMMGNNMMGRDMTGRDTTGRDMTGRDMMGRDMMGRNMMERDMMGRDMMDRNMMERDRMDRDRMERDAAEHDMQDMCYDRIELLNQFRQLWVEHTQWTAFTILSMVLDLPMTDVYTKRLLRNPTDFANALAPFYGEAAAKEFEQLLAKHLTIAAEIVTAAKSGDNNAMTDADKRWHENAEQIAALLASLNPFWNEDDWNAMLNEHLENVSNYAETLLLKDYEGNVGAFDRMEAQVLEMGDMMAEGISMQFPS